VTGLEGTDAAGLVELAKKAEGGCPVSNALRNNVEITVDAAIAQTA
jgi:organic hydroperoxide reductase OsmC/OhrA